MLVCMPKAMLDGCPRIRGPGLQTTYYATARIDLVHRIILHYLQQGHILMLFIESKCAIGVQQSDHRIHPETQIAPSYNH